MYQSFVCCLLLTAIFTANVSAKEKRTITEKVARFQCPNISGNGTALTVDLNSIRIKSIGTSENFTKYYNLYDNKRDFARIKNYCRFNENGTFQALTLKLDASYRLEFQFEGNATSYHLANIVLHRVEFRGHSSRPRRVHQYASTREIDLRMGGTHLKAKIQCYHCYKIAIILRSLQTTKAETVEALADIGKNQMDYEANKKKKNKLSVQPKKIELELDEFMFFAFQNNIDPRAVTRMECRKPTHATIVPIVVGGALLAFAAVVAVTYFGMKNGRLCRRKSTMTDHNSSAGGQ